MIKRLENKPIEYHTSHIVELSYVPMHAGDYILLYLRAKDSDNDQQIEIHFNKDETIEILASAGIPEITRYAENKKN